MSLGICPHAITQLSQSEEVDPPGYLSSYLHPTCYNLNMKVCLDSLLQCLVLIMTEGLDSLLQCLVLIMPGG